MLIMLLHSRGVNGRHLLVADFWGDIIFVPKLKARNLTGLTGLTGTNIESTRVTLMSHFRTKFFFDKRQK
jgi:hypothetical protein